MSQVLQAEARALNRQERSRALVTASNTDDAELAQISSAHPGRPCDDFDLAGLADQHFAIAEKRVDEARSSFPGNWVLEKHKKFCSEYGSITVTATAEAQESDSEPSETSCQVLYPPCGICCKQLPGNYGNLRAECNALLRKLRSIRREQGYTPAHGLLLVMDVACEEVLEMHLLSRVSFSPFDFTAVEQQPASSRLPTQAEARLSNNQAIFRTMPQLLCKLTSLPQFVLCTAEYRALSLNAIKVDGALQRLSELRIARPVVNTAEDSDTDHEEVLFGQMRGILKRAISARSAPKPQPKRPNADAASAATAVCDASDAADRTIEAAWLAALDDEMGVVPRVPSEPSSSSSSRDQKREATHAPVPELAHQETDPGTRPHVPWKDDKGYCWVMVPPAPGATTGTQTLKKIHLGGLALSNG